ncbi:MAG: hypothetical protein LBC04_01055 [Holosporaceae bacterium]|jgi:hypothetical protein|nr:hypothetical protein [Holosporaceae bacterium]
MKKTIELSFLLMFIGTSGNVDANLLDKARAKIKAAAEKSSLLSHISSSSFAKKIAESETAKTALSLGEVAANVYGQKAITYALNPVNKATEENAQALQAAVSGELATNQNLTPIERANLESAASDLHNAQVALTDTTSSPQQSASNAGSFIQQAVTKLGQTQYREWLTAIYNTANAVATGNTQEAIKGVDNMAASKLKATAGNHGIVQ